MQAAIVLLAILVLGAQWLRTLPEVQSLLTDRPGQVAPAAGQPVGFPAWLNWSHFFNSLLILPIIRTKGKPTKISIDL